MQQMVMGRPNIIRYIGYLIGTEKRLVIYASSDKEKETQAKQCVQWAVHELLGWTDEEAMEHMTPAIMHDLALDRLVDQYIQLPKDCKAHLDYAYIMAVCLGRHLDVRVQILQYKRLLDQGVIARFPKELFVGDMGRKRLRYLIMDFIENSIKLSGTPLQQKEKLYALFADSTAMNRCLKEHNLFYAYRNFYSTPLEALHYSLNFLQRDDFLYAVMSFNALYDATRK